MDLTPNIPLSNSLPILEAVEATTEVHGSIGHEIYTIAART